MRFSITFVFVIYCFFAFSQNAKVVGKVTDDDNKPLFGATIIYKKDITVGAHSDENGNYLLEIPEGDAVLIFRYSGMKTDTVQISVSEGEIKIGRASCRERG